MSDRRKMIVCLYLGLVAFALTRLFLYFNYHG